MLDCLGVPQSLLILCEEQSFRLGKSLSSCVTEALTDWVENQTGRTILELVGIENDEHDGPHLLSLMAKTA